MTLTEKILENQSFYPDQCGSGIECITKKDALEFMKQAAWHFYSERQRHIAELTNMTYDEDFTRITFEQEWNQQL